ncbi:Uncharacterised protein [[Pasteurella] mairii]|uniref:Uncharacterized protein n=1 Tax=[Pasteurella] mairii TaxID=757 RepID=A0A379B575_9PAST|nr:Uncharacterised protein [[Pasteurella] mairii]
MQGDLPIDIKFTNRAKYYQWFDDFHKNQQDIDSLVELVSEYKLSELARQEPQCGSTICNLTQFVWGISGKI